MHPYAESRFFRAAPHLVRWYRARLMRAWRCFLLAGGLATMLSSSPDNSLASCLDTPPSGPAVALSSNPTTFVPQSGAAIRSQRSIGTPGTRRGR
jgi:hypothetical protein